MKRLLYIDVLNVLACIAVIALHHNGIVHSFDGSSAWCQSLVVECVCYWAVPVFLMISGANLFVYRERYDTKKYFQKRFERVFIPWLFWSVFLLIEKTYTGRLVLDSLDVRYLLDLIVNNKVEDTYWFFTILFSGYLMIPVFSLLTSHRKTLWYVVGIDFVMISCAQLVKKFTGFAWGGGVSIGDSLFIFMILGYLLSTQDISLRCRISIYSLGIMSVAIRYIFTLVKSFDTGEVNKLTWGYMTPLSVLWAVSVFVLVRRIEWEKVLSPWISSVITKLSSYSFGVYLIHKLIMYIESHVIAISKTSLIWRVPFVLVTYVISVSVVWIIRKIPVLKRVV